LVRKYLENNVRDKFIFSRRLVSSPADNLGATFIFTVCVRRVRFPARRSAKAVQPSFNSENKFRFFITISSHSIRSEAHRHSQSYFESRPPLVLQHINRLRPFVLEQSRKRSIRQQFAVCLAAWTVVGFVFGVTNALNSLVPVWT
jgi:hypothetical protein